METRTIYYARVSTKGQNLDRQLAEFAKMGATERDIICDKASGKDLDRPGYQAVKMILRDGDTLVIKSLDRLSRSKADIAEELRWLRQHNVRLKVCDLPSTLIDYPDGQGWVLDMVNNILVEVLSSIAQQERETLLRRQAEGIAAMATDEKGRKVSRKTGKNSGRPETVKPANWCTVIDDLNAGRIKPAEAIRRTGLSKSTFYRMVKEG